MEAGETTESGSRTRWWQPILFRILWLLFFLQSVAVLIALWIQSDPNAFGYVYSFGLGLYFGSFLVGITLAAVVVVPFAFAWLPGSLLRRIFVVGVSVSVFIGINFAGYLAYDTAFFSIPGSGLDIFPFFKHYAFMSIGVAMPPMAFRVWRGWHLVKSNGPRGVISIVERRSELLFLIAAFATAFLLSRETTSDAGTPIITFVFGVGFSLFIFLFGFWFFRFRRMSVLFAFTTCSALLLVGLPLAIAWGIDSFYGALPGVWETASIFASMFAALLVEASIVRALGYRMEQAEFELPAQVIEKKAVVDPFSD